MIKSGDLKQGNLVYINHDNEQKEGTVVKVSSEEKQALVNNGVQEFWYDLDEINSIPLDDNQLLKLGFTKEEADGMIKYKRDSFRLITPRAGDFSSVEMWWREDRRHFDFPIGVHDLQNLYLDMNKVTLEKH
ncbi:MAG: hypothetical protein ACSLE0_12790 [Chitinophagaceae bacterium]